VIILIVCGGKATIFRRGVLKMSPTSRTLNVAEREAYLIEAYSCE